MTVRRPSFGEFCRRLGVRSTTAQRIQHAVCFDRAHPADFEGAERDIAFQLFGSLAAIPDEARSVVVWRKGARSGGTYFAALFALYAALTLPLTTLAPGEHAFAVIVAPDMRLGRQALRFVLGALGTRRELQAATESQTSDSVTIRRDDGRPVTIEVLPATRGGSALRGRSLVCAVLSEASFFFDDSHVVNDQDVYKAVAPRVVAGGIVLIESTPWIESGLLFELDRDNFGTPTTCVVAHCPTLLMRDDAETIAMVNRERERNPDNAVREFDGEYLASGSGVFFSNHSITHALELGELIGAA